MFSGFKNIVWFECDNVKASILILMKYFQVKWLELKTQNATVAFLVRWLLGQSHRVHGSIGELIKFKKRNIFQKPKVWNSESDILTLWKKSSAFVSSSWSRRSLLAVWWIIFFFLLGVWVVILFQLPPTIYRCKDDYVVSIHDLW